MNKMNETKTLIVNETVCDEFEVPASMPESDLSLRRFFAAESNPWSDADFSAITSGTSRLSPRRRRDAASRLRGSSSQKRTDRPAASSVITESRLPR
jgi:hypothetical protein